MNIFDLIRSTAELGLLEGELSEALTLYWDTAREILSGSGIALHEKPAGFLDLENNFFSAIFLYSYHRAGLPRERRVLYAALKTGLRLAKS